jgi:uncharacterized secreted protein with C-terminal beta-propeller domain
MKDKHDDHDKDDEKMDDEEKKFILMGIDDAGEVADVLKSKTSKRILDYLADEKEASEKDIADGLNMPINTVEYNLKKLIKAGFVKKSKNFFWSVKGKKIEVYKLARKHIIISPNKKKPTMSYLKTLLPVMIAVLAIIALVALFTFPETPEDDGVITITPQESKLKQFSSEEQLKSFLEENSESASNFYGALEGMTRSFSDAVITPGAAGVAKAAGVAESAGAGGGTDDYSTTNIQVEGVDEADIVKNDGKYIYTVVQGKVVIVDAYPAEEMNVVGEIEINGSVSQIFVNEDKLVLFSYGYSPFFEVAEVEARAESGEVAEAEVKAGVTGASMVAPCYGGYCGGYGGRSIVYIYDIEDRENPQLEHAIEYDGNFVNSRMIGDYVYVISTKYVNVRDPVPPILWYDGERRPVSADGVYYWNYPDTSYVFTTITAIDVDDGDFESKVYLTGGTRTIYVSMDNIYLTYQKRFDYSNYVKLYAEEVAYPLLPSDKDEEVEEILEAKEFDYLKLGKIKKIIFDYSMSLTGSEKEELDSKLQDLTEDFQLIIQKKMEKTVIHKINIDEDEISYKGVGEVPGRVLNQFSMDEYKGNFRVATTTGQVSRSSGGGSMNHLYILDEDLEIIGKVEDLAEGERIYSARFMGKRAYMVTFKKVDPLFVIDVSNPKNPEVLGYLKITGYSDYLHPYDEDHIIGIGKETAGGNEQFSWYQGVKISLFDVSDVHNPIERAKIEIGDRGTNSDALRDHKAVLFDKERGILVVPIQLNEIDESQYDGEIPDNAHGQFVWQGAYVLNIDKDGISLRGKISHDETYIPAKEEPIGTVRVQRYGNKYEKIAENTWKVEPKYRGSYYRERNYTDMQIDNMFRYPDYNRAVKRSLYMDDVLYTVSMYKVKANDLSDLFEISDVKISDLDENPYDY